MADKFSNRHPKLIIVLFVALIGLALLGYWAIIHLAARFGPMDLP